MRAPIRTVGSSPLSTIRLTVRALTPMSCCPTSSNASTRLLIVGSTMVVLSMVLDLRADLQGCRQMQAAHQSPLQRGKVVEVIPEALAAWYDYVIVEQGDGITLDVDRLSVLRAGGYC